MRSASARTCGSLRLAASVQSAQLPAQQGQRDKVVKMLNCDSWKKIGRAALGRQQVHTPPGAPCGKTHTDATSSARKPAAHSQGGVDAGMREVARRIQFDGDIEHFPALAQAARALRQVGLQAIAR